MDECNNKPTTTTTTTRSIVSRIQINDNKAGMENIDKEKINSIIMKHTLNSRYYKKQQSKEFEIKNRATQKLFEYSKYTQKQILNAENMADVYISKLNENRDLTRILVHIDMDAFYANVEIRDNPSLKDKPMAVGSESMLSTSNYIARKYGVRAAMPGFIAKELCPELVIVPCNFDKYRVESGKIMKVISQYDDNYAAMSLDEAYLDLTQHLKLRSSFDISKRTYKKHPEDIENSNETICFGVDVEDCVREIRHRIYLTTQLTASAGITCNLRLAKLCSDINKPNGQYYLESNVNRILEFIRKMPIKKFNGIGPSQCLKLESYGIHICEDLYKKRALLKLLETQNTFEFLMNVCMGVGCNYIEQEDGKKSLGHETTFTNICEKSELLNICKELSDCVAKELIEDNLEASKVNLKLKTIDFQVLSRTKTLKQHTNNSQVIYMAAKELFENELNAAGGASNSADNKNKYRLLGVRVSDLRDATRKRLKTIDTFMKSKSSVINTNISLNEDDDKAIDLCEFYHFKCPICDEIVESNLDFMNHHTDLCLLRDYEQQSQIKY